MPDETGRDGAGIARKSTITRGITSAVPGPALCHIPLKDGGETGPDSVTFLTFFPQSVTFLTFLTRQMPPGAQDRARVDSGWIPA